MNLTRKESIITGGEIEELSSIKYFPIFTGATEEHPSKDIFADLTFDICKDSGCIQLRNLIDPGLLYSNFHSEALGSVWTKHHELFSELVLKYASGKNIAEVGGSNGSLARTCLKAQEKIKSWTIIDPNLTFESYVHSKLTYWMDFLDEHLIKGVDMVVHSHTWEHAYDPVKFLSTISTNLNDGDYHIFSIPNQYAYLKNGYINTLTFEHTFLLTEELVDCLLSCADFDVVEKIYHEDHSIFYVTKKRIGFVKSLPGRYENHKRMYLDFWNNHKRFVLMVNKIMAVTDKKIYLFGGHIFSQYLIAMGLDTKKIVCILDNSGRKNGKRLYGTSLIIRSPKQVDLNNAMVILKAGSYSDEIEKGLLSLRGDIEILK